jgi:hypothetical protein
MDVYSHMLLGVQEQAMALLDGVLPAAKMGCLRESEAKSAPLLNIKGAGL